MSDLDPCESCEFHKWIFDQKDECFKEYCTNKKPCPYISLDTIQ